MILDILEEHIKTANSKCVVGKWLSLLTIEEQDKFKELIAQEKINASDLFRRLDIRHVEEVSNHLPFKLTAFKAHTRGYCTCPQQ